MPGVYTLRVDLQGFQPQVMNKIELQVQQTVRLDVALKLGSVEVAVEVTGTAPMINITDATVGTVVDNKQILELPLNGRNFINLVALSQNVSSDYAGGRVEVGPVAGREAIGRRRTFRLPASAASKTTTRSTAS